VTVKENSIRHRKGLGTKALKVRQERCDVNSNDGMTSATVVDVRAESNDVALTVEHTTVYSKEDEHGSTPYVGAP